MGNCICKQRKCQVHPTRRNKTLKYEAILNSQWLSAGPMTKGQLLRLREAYWLQKSAEGVEQKTWLILKDIVYALLDQKFDVAQAIMDESDLFSPHGDLGTILDFDGNVFEVSGVALNSPMNMVVDEEDNESGIGSGSVSENTSTDVESTGGSDTRSEGKSG